MDPNDKTSGCVLTSFVASGKLAAVAIPFDATVLPPTASFARIVRAIKMYMAKFQNAISRCQPGATPQAELTPSLAGRASCPMHEIMVSPASNLRYRRSDVPMLKSPLDQTIKVRLRMFTEN